MTPGKGSVGSGDPDASAEPGLVPKAPAPGETAALRCRPEPVPQHAEIVHGPRGRHCHVVEGRPASPWAGSTEPATAPQCHTWVSRTSAGEWGRAKDEDPTSGLPRAGRVWCSCVNQGAGV